jgi:hypothetical protein
MEKGEWHPSCKVCKKVEGYGGTSVRQLFNKDFHSKHQVGITKRESIKFLEINFSNLCNLSCRMCSSKASTGRIPLEKHIGMKYTKHISLDEQALSYLYDINNVKDIKIVQIF